MGFLEARGVTELLLLGSVQGQPDGAEPLALGK